MTKAPVVDESRGQARTHMPRVVGLVLRLMQAQRRRYDFVR